MRCKSCRSTRVIKNGTQTKWKGGATYKIQMYKCMACGRNMSKHL